MQQNVMCAARKRETRLRRVLAAVWIFIVASVLPWASGKRYEEAARVSSLAKQREMAWRQVYP